MFQRKKVAEITEDNISENRKSTKVKKNVVSFLGITLTPIYIYYLGSFKMQWKPINVITLRMTETDNIDQIITKPITFTYIEVYCNS